MLFRVVDYLPTAGPLRAETFYLERDKWNDFGYITQFYLSFATASLRFEQIGRVKIANRELESKRPSLPEEFESLDEGFFSLGQEDTYYDKINSELGDDASQLFAALKDIAFDPVLRASVLDLDVTSASLLREVQVETVRNQFHRIATGGARLSPFEFVYTNPDIQATSETSHGSLRFKVVPNTLPPTNVHALIGRNGAGKTRILRDLSRLTTGLPSDIMGTLTNETPDSELLFGSTVLVSFSAFDAFDQSRTSRHDRPTPRWYVGLYDDQDAGVVKDSDHLTRDFVRGVIACNQPGRSRRWTAAIKTLNTDPEFRSFDLDLLLRGPLLHDDAVAAVAQDLFSEMSSGHKIVALTVTRLVEYVAERTLVLIDEPEAHLHPPLLGAFVRVLASLLTDRNGVAVIATHSPVVLQEIPSSCTWIIRRSGNLATAIRPSLETFGESVSLLSEDVFGLELTEAGFHSLIEDLARDGLTYDEILMRFDYQLGGEAKAIARILARDNAGS